MAVKMAPGKTASAPHTARTAPGSTVKARFTSEELERLQEELGKNYELVRGELYEVLPTTFHHGAAALRIGSRLLAWADDSGTGQVVTEGGYTLERAPDTVRGPDISFISKGRLTPKQARRGFPDLGPDLAIEIRSPNETWRHLEQKAREYFAAGSRMVWFAEIDQFVEVLRPNGERKRLHLDDEIEVDDVLPGFRCRVRDLFPPE